MNNKIAARLAKIMADCAYLMSLAIATGDDSEADVTTDIRNNPPPANEHLPRKQDIEEAVCTDCGARLTPGVLKVSVSKYGSPLCMKCQKLHNAA